VSDPVEQLVLYVARNLVADPDAVQVERREADDAVMYTLRVAPDDVGKVIGRGGRLVRSLRTVVRASGAKVGERRLLEIAE
jgi:predicted RNA-binding protein YlqC (UPF0109 family)